MSMIGKFGEMTWNKAAWVLFPMLAAAWGSWAAVRAESPSQPPAISELREQPDVRVLPARTFKGLDELADASDFAGAIEVTNVTAVKDAKLPSPSGLEVWFGYVEIEAKVLSTAKGAAERGTTITFREDAWFKPGTEELASPEVLPVLQAGKTYLVFLSNGRLVYPGGVYAQHGGKVWFIGQWESSGSRTYPAGLSGMATSSAIELIKGVR